MGPRVGSCTHRRAQARTPGHTRALSPARCGGGERLHQPAVRGARATTKPPREAGEDGQDAGAASSILPAAAPPPASPGPQTPRPAAPQPDSRLRRREEREEEEGEREEEEEVAALSPGIRARGGQGCGRQKRTRPRGEGRAGLRRGCSRSSEPSSGPPPSLAAPRSPGHRALTLRVEATGTRSEAQLAAGRTLRTRRMNDASAAHWDPARVTPVSADAGPPRIPNAEPRLCGRLWGNLLGTVGQALGPTPISARRTLPASAGVCVCV